MTTPLMAIPTPQTAASPLSVSERHELKRCELTIHRHRSGFVATAMALHTIWEKKLWRETHMSFESYCRQKWDLGKSQAYRYLEGYRIIEQTPNAEGLGGAALRVLACAPPQTRQELIDLARRQVAQARAPLFAGQIADEPADESITLTAADIETVIGALHTLTPAQQMQLVADAEQQLIEATKDQLPGEASARATAVEYRAKGLRRLEMVRKIAVRFGWVEWAAAIQAALQAVPPPSTEEVKS